MRILDQTHIIFLTIAVNAFCPAMAEAAVITNLDSKLQSIEISATDGDFHTVSIASNETYRVPGKLVVRYHGREVHMNNDEEYAIWKDDEFGPQMRETHGKGNLSQ